MIGCFFRYMYFLFKDWTPLFADCFLLNKTMKVYILSVLLFNVVFCALRQFYGTNKPAFLK